MLLTSEDKPTLWASRILEASIILVKNENQCDTCCFLRCMFISCYKHARPRGEKAQRHKVCNSVKSDHVLLLLLYLKLDPEIIFQLKGNSRNHKILYKVGHREIRE